MKTIRKSVRIMFVVLLLSLSAFAAERRYLVPGGHTIGMKAYTQGLLVTAVEGGSPAHRAGLREGDILCRLNEIPLRSTEQLSGQLFDGESLRLAVSRCGTEKTVLVRPEFADGVYRLGALVRDNIAGIGTVTYYDPQTGAFGALGHGISDPGGSGILPISGGDVIHSCVRDVVKGVSGSAGQLRGEYDVDRICGTLHKNTPQGVFGVITEQKGLPIPVAEAREVRAGKAEIYCNVQGEQIETFEVEIVRCYEADASDCRNMLLRITDPELLSVTGGIVQGMSGSPIIQDGKLVGAVTHVCVNL